MALQNVTGIIFSAVSIVISCALGGHKSPEFGVFFISFDRFRRPRILPVSGPVPSALDGAFTGDSVHVESLSGYEVSVGRKRFKRR